MPRYSEDIINEVFAENDIVDFVSQYVHLKRAGKDYSGLCPFHGEKTPSFHVNREKQLFHCFGCGAGGNLIQFAMKIEGLDFVEALKLLADRAGIILPEDNGVTDDIIHEKKQKIYKMNKFSARFFYKNLVKEKKGAVALAYFKERKISARTITAYGLGYAPNERTALTEALMKEGYTKEEIVEAGLATERDSKVLDKFRNRVMFPIIDLRGNVIGFGGRIMGQAKEINGFKIPKYLNSPETLAFNKGRNLFSLNFAKNEASGRIILVEGYMDVISVYQAGVTNIAATLGTAITPDQAKLLLRYCSEILLCYDSDEAGEKATIRAIDVINGVGGKARIIRLKGAKDPDEYIKKNGVGAFKQALDNAIPSTEYRISKIRRQFDTDTVQGKAEFVTNAAESLLNIQNDIEVDAYIKKMSEETGIRADAIYSEYNKKKKNANMRLVREPELKKTAIVKTDAGDGTMPILPPKAEALILNLIIKNKKYVDIVKEYFAPEDFSSVVSRKLLEIIYSMRAENKVLDPAVILSEFSGDEAQAAAGIFYENEVYSNDEKALNDLIIDLKRDRLNKEIAKTTDPIKLKGLIEEKKNLGRI